MTENFDDSYTTHRLDPFAGAVISDCIKEATILALTEGWRVSFVHNDKLYEIFPSEVIAFVMEKATALPTT